MFGAIATKLNPRTGVAKMSIHKICARIAALTIVCACLASTHLLAQTEQVLLSFSGTNGNGPQSGLIEGGKGIFYGTTETGGTDNEGTVFELANNASGWNEKVLHNFGTGSEDGAQPVAGLVMDSAGHFYGTTREGGAYGFGTVFELLRRSGGGWVEKILHSFQYNDTEGNTPYGGLILDSAGNLYGACWGGGHKNYGTVFELLPGKSGWQEKTLANFNGLNGSKPVGSLIFDSGGNLYGTTLNGGASGFYGTVFELTPSATGAWTVTTLYAFDNYDGADPQGALVFDAAGNLYGTTVQGGSGFGYVFELSPNASGMWNYTALLEFTGGTTGGYPGPTLIFDQGGNLYGTAFVGGEGNGGVVFELSPSAGGAWNQTILYNFVYNGPNGSGPTGPLVLDSSGNLYGTTNAGGSSNEGVAYEITP
jgi:uncharacterized repeat protein (TIGR03803 family)